MEYRDGLLYLVSQMGMKIAVTDHEGNFVKGYDLVSILGMSEESRADAGIDGFSLDGEGNMLFTLPVTAKACKLSPDGTVAMFGKRGSAPGKFGVPSGIVADKSGNYLVSDKLRCVILVFDSDFKFVKEFGYPGKKPDRLLGPSVMAFGAEGKLYVGQLGKRGVNVYRVSSNG
jgi:hypothetical protein